MPLERVSQSFKDVSMTFQSSPLNNDVLTLKNERAIARSIRNIVFTLPGEKPFEPDFGSKISQSLFENIDETQLAILESTIEADLSKFFPNIKPTLIEVAPSTDSNSIFFHLRYAIVDTNVADEVLINFEQ